MAMSKKPLETQINGSFSEALAITAFQDPQKAKRQGFCPAYCFERYIKKKKHNAPLQGS